MRDVIYLGGEPVAEADAGGLHELHKDHLGSPRVVTKGSTGQIEGRIGFGPYGERIPNGSADNTYQPLTGYTGHLQEDATGLIYMRGRYYSPAWHRFLNSDQGVDPNQWNQMAYVGGSPFMGTDPSGLQKGFRVDCVNGYIAISFFDTDQKIAGIRYTDQQCDKEGTGFWGMDSGRGGNQGTGGYSGVRSIIAWVNRDLTIGGPLQHSALLVIPFDGAPYLLQSGLDGLGHKNMAISTVGFNELISNKNGLSGFYETSSVMTVGFNASYGVWGNGILNSWNSGFGNGMYLGTGGVCHTFTGFGWSIFGGNSISDWRQPGR